MKTMFPMFILHLVDDGLLREIVPEFDLVQLAEIADDKVSNYLEQNGMKEEGDIAYKTEDGYAVILYVPSNPSEPRTPLWTYHFDGTEDVSESLSVIREQILKSNCEMLVIPEDLLKKRVVDAITDFCNVSYTHNQMEPVQFKNLNGIMLADNILSKITESSHGFSREWGM